MPENNIPKEGEIDTTFDFIGETFLPAEDMQVTGVVLKSIDELMAWIEETTGNTEFSAYDVIQWLKKNEYKNISLESTSMWMLKEVSH